MKKCLPDKADVVQIDREILRLAREKERRWGAMSFKDQLPENEASLVLVDQEILRIAADQKRYYPMLSFNETILKVSADHRRLIQRKRALEGFITAGLVEMGMRAGGRAA
jgi:hypothetical protein